jgi:alpha-galactosidase
MARLTEWPNDLRELVRQEAAIYKSLRGLIRDGRVYHLLKRPDGFSIDAIESFHVESNRGVVFVYRPESPENLVTIHPRGLDARSFYRVTFQESATVLVDSGANLMANGIGVSLPTKDFAEIVYINGMDLARPFGTTTTR